LFCLGEISVFNNGDFAAGLGFLVCCIFLGTVPENWGLIATSSWIDSVIFLIVYSINNPKGALEQLDIMNIYISA
jgi:hypothetical protein